MNMKKILMAAFAALAIFGCNKENNGAVSYTHLTLPTTPYV